MRGRGCSGMRVGASGGDRSSSPAAISGVGSGAPCGNAAPSARNSAASTPRALPELPRPLYKGANGFGEREDGRCTAGSCPTVSPKSPGTPSLLYRTFLMVQKGKRCCREQMQEWRKACISGGEFPKLAHQVQAARYFSLDPGPVSPARHVWECSHIFSALWRCTQILLCAHRGEMLSTASLRVRGVHRDRELTQTQRPREGLQSPVGHSQPCSGQHTAPACSSMHLTAGASGREVVFTRFKARLVGGCSTRIKIPPPRVFIRFRSCFVKCC